LRIMPLYFAVIFVWSFFYHGYGRYFLLSSVFCANFARLLQIPHALAPGTLWSLAVEEHFYLVWPLVVLLLSESALAFTAGGIFVLTPLLRGIFAAHGTSPDLMYDLSWFRFDGLAAGALLAIWARSAFAERRHSVRLCLILLAAFIVLTAAGIPFGLLGTASPVAVALRYTQAYLLFAIFLVFVLAFRGSRWTSPLRWRFFQLAGALSFCLYLIHHSVGDGYEFLLKRSGFPLLHYVGPSGAVFVRGVVMLGVSFAIALASRKYLEEPFLSLKHKFTESASPTTGPIRVVADAGPPLQVFPAMSLGVVGLAARIAPDEN